MFEDKVVMHLVEVQMFPEKREPVNENKVILKIADGLRELEWEINKQPKSLKLNNIIRMLQKICRLEEFSIYIFEDDEAVEYQVEYTGENDILFWVSMALKWESPQNIRIFGKI